MQVNPFTKSNPSQFRARVKRPNHVKKTKLNKTHNRIGLGAKSLNQSLRLETVLKLLRRQNKLRSQTNSLRRTASLLRSLLAGPRFSPHRLRRRLAYGELHGLILTLPQSLTLLITQRTMGMPRNHHSAEEIISLASK